MVSATWDEVRARRLARCSLVERAGSDRLVEVAHDLGGVHAQVQASAELQLAVRVDGITQGDVRAAVWDALDGRCLLREELAEEVVKRVGPGPQQRLLSGFAFFLGELCQGPPQGTKVTFVRPDQWIDGWQEVEEQEALLEVSRRYLHTYGPGRPADFREWFSSRAFNAAQAGALFDSLGNRLEEIDVEGHRAHVLAGDTVFPKLRRGLRLLPEYDVYIMGFREREHLVREAVREQIAAHGRGRYEGPAGVRLVIIDGVAAGLWERKKRGKRIELHVP